MVLSWSMRSTAQPDHLHRQRPNDVGISPLVHGILPNDTYTVTLVSAGNGFQDITAICSTDGGS